MVSSRAATADDYLDELPDDRRAVVATLRKLIVKSLPKGYVETMRWGMLTYEIPLSRYPDTYNGQPLSYVALAAQKNNYSLYLMGVYGDKKLEKLLRDSFKAAGKKLDMGKSCVRFKRLDDLPLDTIGRIIAATPVNAYLERYESVKRK